LFNSNHVAPYGTPGGGAIQLSSAMSIYINGVIDVRGSHGDVEQGGSQGAII
jgi:hypothetical protein